MPSTGTLTTNKRFKCSFCDSNNLIDVINFGDVALAGAFLNYEETINEKKYPLNICFCQECFMLQVVDIIKPEKIFSKYFYSSSAIKTLRDHFNRYAKDISSIPKDVNTSIVLEFGCNDGVLLKPLLEQNFLKVIGVDPASNIINNINKNKNLVLYNDFFTKKLASSIVDKYGKIDIIIANNVFAHISTIKDTTSAIYNSLSDNGIFIFEVHYLSSLIDELQYDMIYHEHLFYYSFLSAKIHFSKFNMNIYDVKKIPIHGGSIRFYVCKKGSEMDISTTNVKRLEEDELKNNYNKYSTFVNFADQINNSRNNLKKLLLDLKSKGNSIVGYGASGRANTIIQFCDIDKNILDYMIDDAPHKQGLYTPGSHLKIHNSSKLYSKKPPDYVLLFAWSFAEEIFEKNYKFINNGGRFIIPLPKLRIYP